jgi:ABC-type branched-subunit amino acid transport system ATPase component
VQVQGVTKVFKGAAGVKVAVNNLAFTVSHGECFGLIGPNGGGMSRQQNQKSKAKNQKPKIDQKSKTKNQKSKI